MLYKVKQQQRTQLFYFHPAIKNWSYQESVILSLLILLFNSLPLEHPISSLSLSLWALLVSAMASLADIGVSATINILSAFAFLLAFALLRIQPINDRVYFPKWYLSGGRSSPRSSGNFVGKFVNLNFKTYLTFLNWMPQALRMSESEIISHAGLDSAAFLRIYTLGYSSLLLHHSHHLSLFLLILTTSLSSLRFTPLLCCFFSTSTCCFQLNS